MFGKCSDKRVSIELSALRQSLCQLPDGTILGDLRQEYRDKSCLTDTLLRDLRPAHEDRDTSSLDRMIRPPRIDLISTDASILVQMKQLGTLVAGVLNTSTINTRTCIGGSSSVWDKWWNIVG